MINKISDSRRCYYCCCWGLDRWEFDFYKGMSRVLVSSLIKVEVFGLVVVFGMACKVE